jgi:hypothetical protein
MISARLHQHNSADVLRLEIALAFRIENWTADRISVRLNSRRHSSSFAIIPAPT